MVVEQHYDWTQDPYWARRRLSPAQLLIHDIDFTRPPPPSTLADGGGRLVDNPFISSSRRPRLEINEVFVSTLLPALADRNRLSESVKPEQWTPHREKQRLLQHLVSEFGWMNCLRRESDSPHLERCRWIHISSKFTEYLAATLLALSDRDKSPDTIFRQLYQLDRCTTQNERFSKHGRYFAPFFQDLDDRADAGGDDVPQLLSLPFLDWSTAGQPPPLRWQIDPREGYQSSKSSCHLLRSILQYFYRLEDTADREHNQVFTKHKPWLTDRHLDLKVRRWYGHYPGALNVDELWVLVVDSRHVVTFSSNQTWKSRWPPLQLGYMIAEISFRNIRNKYFFADEQADYTAYTHLIACVSGAVGLLHRSFWEIPLCLTDRYAGYLGHLQFRLHRAPSTRLVMELLQVQEELNIVIQITEQQIQVISAVKSKLEGDGNADRRGLASTRHAAEIGDSESSPETAALIASASELLESLQREYMDLRDLRDNSNNLFTRTIQLVNMRMEDNGKAILVFTIVTIVFLPLSFVASYLGMNTADIRTMNRSQGLFWVIAGALTAATVAVATFLAFYGGAIVEAFFNWRAGKLQHKQPSSQPLKPWPKTISKPGQPGGKTSTFEVLDGSFGPGKPGFLSGLR